MTRYIAFLRAINVGGHIVKMNTLRSLFESLGFASVETFIASGNVIFETPAQNPRGLERAIEQLLQESLGYEVATFVRSDREVAEIAQAQPFAPAELESDDNTLYVAFLPGAPSPAAGVDLMALRNEVDDFHIRGSEAYWLRRRSGGETTFSAAVLEKTMGVQATMRNANTVRRLAAKYPPSGTKTAQ